MNTTTAPLRSRLDSLLGQRKLLRQQHDDLTEQRVTTADEIALLEKCAALCEHLTDSARERVAAVIGPLCTAALRDVFDPSYKLEVAHQQQPSGKWISRLVASDGMVSGNPMSVRGGSVVNVLGVFLPAAFALLRPDLIRPFLSLDEPLSGVSGERLRAAAESIYQITHDPEHPLQIIITTQMGSEFADLADVCLYVHKAKNGEVEVDVKHNNVEEEL